MGWATSLARWSYLTDLDGRAGDGVGHLPGQVNHVDGLTGDPGGMVLDTAWNAAHHHVSVADRLHLR